MPPRRSHRPRKPSPRTFSQRSPNRKKSSVGQRTLNELQSTASNHPNKRAKSSTSTAACFRATKQSSPSLVPLVALRHTAPDSMHSPRATESGTAGDAIAMPAIASAPRSKFSSASHRPSSARTSSPSRDVLTSMNASNMSKENSLPKPSAFTAGCASANIDSSQRTIVLPTPLAATISKSALNTDCVPVRNTNSTVDNGYSRKGMNLISAANHAGKKQLTKTPRSHPPKSYVRERGSRKQKTRVNNEPKTGEGAVRLKRFVLESHCRQLLQVLLENRSSYDTVLQGSTQASKRNARIGLTKALIEAAPATRSCFGSDDYIEEDGAGKILDILRTLKKKFTASIEGEKNASGLGEEGLDLAWRGFGNTAHAREEAPDLAIQLFADSTAVHLHGLRTSEGDFLQTGVSHDTGAAAEKEFVPRLEEDSDSEEPLVLSQEEVEGPNVIDEVLELAHSERNEDENRERSFSSLPSLSVPDNEPSRQLRRPHTKTQSKALRNIDDVPTPAQSLAQKRAAFQLEKAQKAVRAASAKDHSTSRGQKTENHSGEKSHVDQYFSSLKEESIQRERRLHNAEKNAAEEALAKAGEFRARTTRENIQKAIDVVKDENLSLKRKQAILKMLDCEELSNSL